jgi:polyphosphate glucokinase
MGTTMHILGIDIGGSGIKGAPVDTQLGELLTERYRIPTPQPSKPKSVAEVVGQIVRHFDWSGPIGCTFPAVIQNGMVLTAANVDESWVGTNGDELLEDTSGCPVTLLNDADAAGICEMTFGAGRGNQGVVMILTLGTGVGSAIFNRGVLLPNTELGHLEIRGKEGEDRASDRAREEKGWDWEEWGRRVNEYLNRVEALFWPDLFIIGGGVSKEHRHFFRYLKTRAPIVPAELRNEAGIVGAALAAELATASQRP